MNGLPDVYSHNFMLTAAQCNAQLELSPSMLVQQIIEVATEHADLLGVGFRRLSQGGCLWVLSRIAFEMHRYPGVLEPYILSTWIEDFNRHFSQRNFDIVTPEGEVLGYARTIWVAIDMNTRRPADLGAISDIASTVVDRPCPIDPPSKIRPSASPQIINDYSFQVSDIDFNRHVNSARYVELVLNQMDLDTFDAYRLARFEIIYHHESHYGDKACVASGFADDALVTSISVDGTVKCLARSRMAPRENKILTK
ncbi:MAG: thioesterase [Muribaculaceae bacterium]|nr:thioesterase [Muribaculaceae bacterium]